MTDTEIGCGPVPGRCPCSRTVTVADWQPNRASSILSPWPTALPDRLGPRPARGGPGFRPPRPSLRGPGWVARGTPWRTRCGSSARCWGRSSRSRPDPSCSRTVERIRRRTIALRRGDPEVVLEPDIERERLAAEIGSLDVERAAAVARAFTLYFQLVNLAEERQRIRMLRTRARRAKGRPIDESLGEAVERLAAVTDRAGLEARLRTVEVHPVLTAHPTEARRRTLLVALRRIRPAAGLARRPADDARRGRGPAATPARGDHAAVAHRRPAGRAADAARRGAVGARDLRRDAVHRRPPLRTGRSTGRSIRSRPAVGAPPTTRRPRWPSTPGGPAPAPSRRRRCCGSARGSAPIATGTPAVTAEITLHAARLQADHLLRGYEAVASRLMQTVAARVAPERVDRALDHAPRARRGGAARDDAPAPAPLPRGAVPAAARRDRGAAPADPGRR